MLSATKKTEIYSWKSPADSIFTFKKALQEQRLWAAKNDCQECFDYAAIDALYLPLPRLPQLPVMMVNPTAAQISMGNYQTAHYRLNMDIHKDQKKTNAVINVKHEKLCTQYGEAHAHTAVIMEDIRSQTSAVQSALTNTIIPFTLLNVSVAAARIMVDLNLPQDLQLIAIYVPLLQMHDAAELATSPIMTFRRNQAIFTSYAPGTAAQLPTLKIMLKQLSDQGGVSIYELRPQFNSLLELIASGQGHPVDDLECEEATASIFKNPQWTTLIREMKFETHRNDPMVPRQYSWPQVWDRIYNDAVVQDSEALKESTIKDTKPAARLYSALEYVDEREVSRPRNEKAGRGPSVSFEARPPRPAFDTPYRPPAMRDNSKDVSRRDVVPTSMQPKKTPSSCWRCGIIGHTCYDCKSTRCSICHKSLGPTDNQQHARNCVPQTRYGPGSVPGRGAGGPRFSGRGNGSTRGRGRRG